MIRHLVLLLPLAILCGLPLSASAQAVWNRVDAARGLDGHQHLYQLDEFTLRERLLLVPHESNGERGSEIELPMPDGSLARFRVVESPILQDQLAAAFPEFRSYRVFGIDDPFASGRFSLSPRGFHGLILTSKGRLFIDPADAAGDGRYLARSGGMPGNMRSTCAVHAIDQSNRPQTRSRVDPLAARDPGKLLEYVVAVSATAEYVTFHEAGVAGAQLEINAAINRVNVIYERDLGIRLILVAGNQNLIEDGGNVSFSNNNAFALHGENQEWIDSQIGSANYDLGHVFSTGAGGLATLGSVCNASTKAEGVSGLSNPDGDPFYIDFVAHEMGHQFNADHSFNGTSFSCQDNRNASTAWEPGSGSTIMSYAGICSSENLQSLSDTTFHAGSIAQIDAFTAGAGAACASEISVSPSNTDPVITSIPNYTIPASTPFRLVATATDAEQVSALLYQWDQMDAGTATTEDSFGTDLGDNALFRSYEPSLEAAQRDFPALGTQVRGLYDPAETLPCQARDVNLRLTVRDNFGGQASEDVRLTVTRNAGPFEVTSHSSTTTETSDFAVTWNVADTSLAPVNCPNVGIDLIAFDDFLYSNHTIHPLIPSTPNNGSALVAWPADSLLPPARGRIRVRCLNNVFYAISQGDVYISGSNSPQTFFDSDNNATFAPSGTRTSTAPACPALSSGDFFGGGRGGGSGSLDPWWLMLFATLALALRRRRA